MTFGEMIDAVRRFWIVAVAVLLVALALAGAAATLPEPKYEATATLLAQPDTDRVDFASIEAVRFLLPSLAELVSTNTFQGQIGEQLEPPLVSDDVDTAAEFEPGTGILRITAIDSTPIGAQRAAQVASLLLGRQQLSDSVEMTVLDAPEVPKEPAGPSRLAYLAGGLILGSFGGILAAIGLAAAARARQQSATAEPTADVRSGAAPTPQSAVEDQFDGDTSAEVADMRAASDEPSTQVPPPDQTDAERETPKFAELTSVSAEIRATIDELQLDLLGLIPIKGASTASASNGSNDFDSAFRDLGDRLAREGAEHPHVLVTSARAGAGRTTVAANVAWALGTGGRAVLAVDGDVEEPTLHRFLRVSNAHGLSELSTAGLASVVQRSSLPNLAVVTAGTAWDVGAPRLDEAMPRLFAEADEDIVLIDGPALPSWPDSGGAWRTTSAVVLVVDATDARSSTDLARCVNELANLDVEVLGVVVNRASQGGM
jgi:Mrp family chromosome partitioning ATPase